MPNGIYRIAKERRRQIILEGYTEEHDLEHSPRDLMRAASAYLTAAKYPHPLSAGVHRFIVQNLWPWEAEGFKPTSPERDLEKAGALIAAALDRL